MRVAAYCRVSTANESQQSSVKNQKEIYKQKIKSNPDWTFAGIYADPEYSGTTGNRPQFQKMLRDAEKGKIDYIITKSISRFARNTLLAIETIQRLKKIDVGVYFEKEKIDTSGPYSEIMLTMFAAFAQDESRNISERVKKGLRMRARNGLVCWAPIFGYNHDYEINEEEAEIVRRIFDEYEAGKTQLEIVEELDLESRWTSAQGKVSRILRQEKYCGDVLTNKKYVKDYMTHQCIRNEGAVPQILVERHHEGIISRAQFDRVQKLLKERKPKSQLGDLTLICPYCGHVLHRHGSKGWLCECNEFYITKKKYLEALEAAKSKHGTGKIMEILFGFHRREEECTMTVLWDDGTETEVPTYFNRMQAALSRVACEPQKKAVRSKIAHRNRVAV